MLSFSFAGVAQLVERLLAKQKVTSSTLVTRSKAAIAQLVEQLTCNQ